MPYHAPERFLYSCRRGARILFRSNNSQTAPVSVNKFQPAHKSECYLQVIDRRLRLGKTSFDMPVTSKKKEKDVLGAFICGGTFTSRFDLTAVPDAQIPQVKCSLRRDDLLGQWLAGELRRGCPLDQRMGATGCWTIVLFTSHPQHGRLPLCYSVNSLSPPPPLAEGRNFKLSPS